MFYEYSLKNGELVTRKSSAWSGHYHCHPICSDSNIVEKQLSIRIVLESCKPFKFRFPELHSLWPMKIVNFTDNRRRNRARYWIIEMFHMNQLYIYKCVQPFLSCAELFWWQYHFRSSYSKEYVPFSSWREDRRGRNCNGNNPVKFDRTRRPWKWSETVSDQFLGTIPSNFPILRTVRA